MADFCKQCSMELFGKDFRELAGVTEPDKWEQGLAARVICEGCGPIQVDPDGNCVTPDCICKGKPGHGLPWKKENSDGEEEADQETVASDTEEEDRWENSVPADLSQEPDDPDGRTCDCGAVYKVVGGYIVCPACNLREGEEAQVEVGYVCETCGRQGCRLVEGRIECPDCDARELEGGRLGG